MIIEIQKTDAETKSGDDANGSAWGAENDCYLGKCKATSGLNDQT